MEQRTILFKAKRLDNSEWVKGNLLLDNSKSETEAWINPQNDKFEFIDVDPSTVCQFTELKDKGDNPIWEHDIVNKNPMTEIIYKCGTFMLYSVVENVERFRPIHYYLENNILSGFKVICPKFDRKEGEK